VIVVDKRSENELMPITLGLWKLRQENLKFEAILGYVRRCCLSITPLKTFRQREIKIGQKNLGRLCRIIIY
jgi:hypothetical protein